MKTHDERYAFRGYFDREPGGACRVRILQGEGRTPILMISELPENETTSVTNLMEMLAPELIGRHLPHRYDAVDEEPVIVVEHYPPVVDPKGRVRQKATYDRVTFASWRPKKIWMHGQERLSLGEPSWTPLRDDEVKTLLGDEADDLPQQGRAPGTFRPSDFFT